jgi:hypothetical protein
MVKIYTFVLTLFLAIGSVSAVNQSVPFKLYPNPMTGDVLQVNYDFEFKAGQTFSFVITNIIGQVVYTHLLTDEEVKRGNFSIRVDEIKLDKGVYLTKMINGDQSSVQKLVVR